jgi:hypothetical protein
MQLHAEAVAAYGKPSRVFIQAKNNKNAPFVNIHCRNGSYFNASDEIFKQMERFKSLDKTEENYKIIRCKTK